MTKLIESYGYIAIRNFERYQHYRDRNPPWIKLYGVLLDDYAFCRLSDQSKFLYVGLLLLAAKTENRIPADPAWMANKLSMTSTPNIKELMAAGFIDVGPGEFKKANWSTRYISASVRTAVLARDGHKCVQCGAIDRLEIDHIVPISRGGTDAESNLRVLCRSCNRRKHNKMDSRPMLDRSSLRERDREETEKIPPTPRAYGARKIGDAARDLVDLYVGSVGIRATDATYRSAQKLVDLGHGARVRAAIAAYLAANVSPEYRIHPHNWFGQQEKWKAWEGRAEQKQRAAPEMRPFGFEENRLLTPEEIAAREAKRG